jgi:hypothetical protein
MVNVKDIKAKTLTNQQRHAEQDAIRIEQSIDDLIHDAAERGDGDVYYSADRTVRLSVLEQIAGKYRDAGFTVDYQAYSLNISIRW